MTEQFNPNKDFVVHRLVVEDIPEIVRLTKEYVKTLPNWGPFDLRTAVENTYQNIDEFGGYKVTLDGKMVAVLVLSEIRYWWTDVAVLTNMLLYVADEYAGEGLHQTLLKLAIAEADRSGIEFHLDTLNRRRDSTIVGKTYRYHVQEIEDNNG